MICCSNASFTTVPSILRYIARAVPQAGLYGSTALQRTEVSAQLTVIVLELHCLLHFLKILVYLS